MRVGSCIWDGMIDNLLQVETGQCLSRQRLLMLNLTGLRKMGNWETGEQVGGEWGACGGWSRAGEWTKGQSKQHWARNHNSRFLRYRAQVLSNLMKKSSRPSLITLHSSPLLPENSSDPHNCRLIRPIAHLKGTRQSHRHIYTLSTLSHLPNYT